jgi:hypothetical protein
MRFNDYGIPMSPRYSALKPENVTVNKQRLSFEGDGRLFVSKWKFEKKKIFRDRSGAAVVTFPQTEICFLVAKNKASMWLTSKEFESLSEIVESQMQRINSMEADKNAY